jgi:hypothetical protein
MNAMFFSTLGGLFPKMDIFKMSIFKKSQKLLKKNDSLHSFRIRPPNLAGVGLPLCYRRMIVQYMDRDHYAAK